MIHMRPVKNLPLGYEFIWINFTDFGHISISKKQKDTFVCINATDLFGGIHLTYVCN